MTLTVEEFNRRVGEVLGHLELDVLDEIGEVEWRKMGTPPGRVAAELVRAQRSLREAEMELERYVDEPKAVVVSA